MATLTGLMLVLPVNLLAVAGCMFVGLLLPRRRKFADERRTVLISGGKMTKALQLARSFHHAGHRVVLIESHGYWVTGHRFSNAVDAFHTVPSPQSSGYAQALLAIVQREHVDVYVPVSSPVASQFDSEAISLLSPLCEVIHVTPDRIGELDDKYQFATTAAALGLRAPKSLRITDPAEVIAFDFEAEPRSYILKSIRYDSVRRLDLTLLPCATPEAMATFVRSLPISEDNPWIMQEFIPGTEYCTHGTFRGGKLSVHCCCVSSAFQINYRNVDRPDIEDWVSRFGTGLSLTGQASFDFIEADDDGLIYAIECNPRTHSAITMFYNHPALADAYLGRSTEHVPIKPLATSRPTYWLYHEIWRLLSTISSPRSAVDRLLTIWRGKEAVFDWRDPLPFLMLHHWHVPMLLLRDLRQGRGWVRIDFNIGKLVQAGGD